MRFLHWRRRRKLEAFPNYLISPSFQRQLFNAARAEGWPPPDLRRIPESLPNLRRLIQRGRRVYVEIPPHVLRQTGLGPDDLVFVAQSGRGAADVRLKLAAHLYRGGNGDGNPDGG